MIPAFSIRPTSCNGMEIEQSRILTQKLKVMKRAQIFILSMIVFLSGVFLASCDKEDNKNPESKATVQLMLTDAPATYDAVNIDIREVMIHTETEGWVSVPLEHPGVYNLLEFSNGIDVLLGTVEIAPGNLSQVRLVLGNENSVVVDGVTYPLTIPSGAASGLKLNLHSVLEGGYFYRFWIDFDAARSIHVTGNGKFMLKPVIRLFTEASSGAVAGKVISAEYAPVITVYNESDTLATFPAADGHFLIPGVPEGTWTVKFSSTLDPLPFVEVILPGVVVVKGKTTVLADVTLMPV